MSRLQLVQVPFHDRHVIAPWSGLDRQRPARHPCGQKKRTKKKKKSAAGDGKAQQKVDCTLMYFPLPQVPGEFPYATFRNSVANATVVNVMSNSACR